MLAVLNFLIIRESFNTIPVLFKVLISTDQLLSSSKQAFSDLLGKVTDYPAVRTAEVNR